MHARLLDKVFLSFDKILKICLLLENVKNFKSSKMEEVRLSGKRIGRIMSVWADGINHYIVVG